MLNEYSSPCENAQVQPHQRSDEALGGFRLLDNEERMKLKEAAFCLYSSL